MKSQNKSKRLWFVTKKYGWGWTPSTWEGWTVLATYVGSNILYSSCVASNVVYDEDVLLALFPFITFSTIILIITCYKKGEPPRWRWGN